MIEGGDKDMGKAQNMEESIWGRGKKNVRVAKKEREDRGCGREGGRGKGWGGGGGWRGLGCGGEGG